MDDVLEENPTKTFPALVSVWRNLPAGGRKFHGSGIVVNSISVLTCHHVLESNRLAITESTSFCIEYHGEFKTVIEWVIHDSLDVALLTLDLPLQKTDRLAFFSDLNPNDAEFDRFLKQQGQVHACGYDSEDEQKRPKYSPRNIKSSDFDFTDQIDQ